jgi:hypothetical protein
MVVALEFRQKVGSSTVEDVVGTTGACRAILTAVPELDRQCIN